MSVDCGDNCWPWTYPSVWEWIMTRHWPLIQWLMVYLVLKTLARLTLGTANSWDKVSLLHNLASVLVGLMALGAWESEAEQSCGSLSAPAAMVLMLQTVHCISDAVIYLDEMIKEPVFIFHHGILFVVSCIQPHCPGCSHLVWAYTIAEFGSATIAVDAEWRKMGGRSRGFSRMALFGLSRLVNLYLLYQLWLITPSTVNFMIRNEDRDIVEVNVPVCMMTNLGGSLTMMAVNGLTWFRMLKAYLKFRKKRKATGNDFGPCGISKPMKSNNSKQLNDKEEKGK